MADNGSVKPFPGPVRRRRRPALRRWLGWLLLVGCVLWLAGQGLGWFGHGATVAGAPDAQRPPTEEPPQGIAVEGVHARPTAIGSAVVVGGGSVGERGGSDGGEAVPPDPAQDPAANAEAAPVAAGMPLGEGQLALDDGLAAQLSLLRFLLGERRCGRAAEVLVALRSPAVGTAALEAPLAALEAEFAALATQLLDELEADLGAGRVAAAHGVCERLWGPTGRSLATDVAALLRARGLGLLLLPEPGVAGDWLEPLPLARQRRLRIAGLGPARLLRWEARQATVDPGTGTFPVVPHRDLEPVDASAEEAVEMGWAALRGGAARLAGLWLLCAERRAGAAGLPPRGAALRAALGG